MIANILINFMNTQAGASEHARAHTRRQGRAARAARAGRASEYLRQAGAVQ